MKQRNRKALLSLGIALVGALLVLLVWAFLPKGYERLIPAQAKAVLRIVPSQLQPKIGDADPLTTTLGISAEGIDLQEALYTFVTPNEYIGFLAAVSDEDALRTQIEKLVSQKRCLPIEKNGGRQWAWLSAGWLLTWDSDAVLAMGPGMAAERDVLRQTMSRMIESGEPFTETNSYENLMKQGGDAQLFAQLDALPSPYNMLFRLGVPPACDPAAVQVFASVSLSKQAGGGLLATIKSELKSENDEILRSMDSFEKGKGCIEKPSKEATDSTLFIMATRTQGQPLLELLRTDATLRGLLMGLNQTIDADKMLGSTNGLLTIEIASLAKDFTPAFCLKAETHTPGLMANAEYWLESAAEQKKVKLERLKDNSFRLSNDGQTLFFGLDNANSMLYFASPSMLPATAKPWPAAKSNGSQGLLTYFHLDMLKLFKQPCMEKGGVATVVKALLPAAHSVTYEARSGRKAEIRIE